MGRIIVPAADDLLDLEIKVLDKGFVRLIDYMGGDDRIVQAARVSYGDGTKSVRQDKQLIGYLLENQHTSPFEQVVLTFHAKMPIFVARQWVRHRTARLNEVSGRYSVMSDEFYAPLPEHVAMQSKDNKQGRGEVFSEEIAEACIEEMKAEQVQLYRSYLDRIDKGMARELARVNLPLSLYTEWYWQIDLHNMLRFLWLRLDSHAQYEVRVYAEAMASCTKAVAPMAYEAFEQHLLGGIRFSVDEQKALVAMLAGGESPLAGRALEKFQDKLKKMRA